MRKLLLLSLSLVLSSLSAQQKNTRIDFFTSLDANIGLELGGVIRGSFGEDDTEWRESGNINAGANLQAGIQPFSWFALAGGLRYSYIDPKFHLLYFNVQPNFVVTGKDSDQWGYVFANYATKLNQSPWIGEAHSMALGAGVVLPFSGQAGHKLQVYLEDQVLNGESNWFLGFSYGISLFRNKRFRDN